MLNNLTEAHDVGRFGGKAAQLALALRAGLPVPAGFALDCDVVEAVAQGRRTIHAMLSERSDESARFAVRSSAIDEDSATSSFAGQHSTLLHVAARDVDDAVKRVWESGRSESALAYRRRRGLSEEAPMAVVIQRMVRARVAGVLFTRHPVTGAEERVIEASWGLGEVVVAGLVTPDSFRLAPDGRILERLVGYKDVEIRGDDEHGVREHPVDEPRATTCCLDDEQLAALHELATRVQRVFKGHHDLEWAFDDEGLHLLQRRSITT